MITPARTFLAATALTLTTQAAAQSSTYPTPDQFTVFKYWVAACTYENGRPTDEDFRRIAHVLIASRPTKKLGWQTRTRLADYAGALLYPAFPGAAKPAAETREYDDKADKAFKGMNRKLRPDFVCPANTGAALPILQWLADDVNGGHFERPNAHAWLGLSALHGIGQSKDENKARLHFLKVRMFETSNTWTVDGQKVSMPYYDASWWSDGKDDDVLANIKRAGLEPYFNATIAAPKGWVTRGIKAKALAKTDAQAAKAMLVAGTNMDAITLASMEEKGTIPKTSTDADLAYWSDIAGNPASGDVMRARAIEIISERNGGTIPVSDARPTATQVYGDFDAASKISIALPAQPAPYRAMVSPEGKPLFVVPCEWNIRTSSEFSEARNRLGAYLAARIKNLPPVMQDGKAVYGWVTLPGPYKDPATGKAALGQVKGDYCKTNPMEKMELRGDIFVEPVRNHTPPPPPPK